ncbi:MAG: hypothetical protein QGH40_03090 [bacterium]|nr:hypothetical protein [bacterium]
MVKQPPLSRDKRQWFPEDQAEERFDRNCCWRCKHFNTCIKNWIRGEKRLPKICCSLCKHYRSCLEKWTRQRGTPSTTRFIH